MIHTAFAAAIERSGLHRRDVKLKIAFSEFFNNGGTVERARELLDLAAAELRANRQASCASNGPTNNAASAQPEAAGTGRNNDVGDDQRTPPEPATADRDGASHHFDANQKTAARAVPVPNKPRGLSELRKIRRVVTPGIFDYKLPSGDAVFRTEFHILPRLKKQHAGAAHLIGLIEAAVSNPDPHKTPADYLSERQSQRIVQKAAELSDAN